MSAEPLTTEQKIPADKHETGQDETQAENEAILNVCSPGLQCLKDIEQLQVKQRQDHREVTSYEYKNTYIITDGKGLKLFTAKEDTDCCTRNYCGSFRAFTLKIKTMAGFQALICERPLRCQRFCFPCCLQEMDIFDSRGEYLGTIEQKWNLLRPSLAIRSPGGDVIFKIFGHCCTCSLCVEVVYEVFSSEGEEIGSIRKPWKGFLDEAFGDPFHFTINFPAEMEPNRKALLLAAYFLIDYMYHEL